MRLLDRVEAQRVDDYVDNYINRFVSDMKGHWGGTLERHGRSCGPIGSARVSRVDDHRRDRVTAYWLVQYIWLRRGRVVAIQAGAPAHAAQREALLSTRSPARSAGSTAAAAVPYLDAATVPACTSAR
ncbi:MAG: hypothetical protein ACOC1F_07165 [Myxococcota bacterium]